jgi:hypothetical protein
MSERSERDSSGQGYHYEGPSLTFSDGKKKTGVVCWKGVQLEVSSFEMSADRINLLVRRCYQLEKLGVIPSSETVTDHWNWFYELNADNPYLPILKRTPEIYENKDGGLLLRFGVVEVECFGTAKGAGGFSCGADLLRTGKDLARTGWHTADVGQCCGNPVGCASGSKVIERLKMNIPEDMVDHIIKAVADEVSKLKAWDKENTESGTNP